MYTLQTILIVDDNALNLSILDEMLSDHFQVVSSRNGLDAVNLAMQYKPDLVLLDVMMPGMNGMEVCRLLRETPELHHTRIIMLSARAFPEEQAEGIRWGANGYLTKPFEESELMDLIQDHLGSCPKESLLNLRPNNSSSKVDPKSWAAS